MASEIELIVQGDAAAEAAAELVQSLAGDDGLALSRRPAAPPDGSGRKAIDVAVIAQILAFPGAALAAWDLSSRIASRARAQRLIETSQRLKIERGVDTLVVTLEGPRALDTLDADRLLELVRVVDGEPQ